MTGHISQATRNRIYNLSLAKWSVQEIAAELKVSESSVVRYMAVSAKRRRSKKVV